MTPYIVAVIIALITFVAGFLLGRAVGVRYSQRIIAMAIQAGYMHLAHPPSGSYDDLNVTFQEPTITGNATLETDYRDPPTGQYL